MILLYRFFINILYPFLIIFIFFRVFLNKEDVIRYKEKIFTNYFNIKKNKNKKLIWFHAASIGEFKSVLPIIKKLNLIEEKIEFLITTNTLSSAQLAEFELKNFNNVKHRFMPLDINYLIKRFLNLWKPETIFLVDSEIWPNLILAAKRKKIPIALLNARLTKKSFDRWLLFPKTAKKIFEVFDLCLCSNNETKNFLEKINAKNIKYIGNIKLINEKYTQPLKSKNDLILSKSRFWIAASIHKEEDIFCLKTHALLKKKFSDITTIIAPRHINRVNEIKSLSESLNFRTQILNRNDEILDDKEVIIINSFGILKNFFKYAKSVFIGKSNIERLKYDSGQNPIDAAYLNCKIYHGPYVSNFSEIYKILKDKNISKKIENHYELSENLLQDLKRSNNKKITIANSMQALSENILYDTSKIIKNFLNGKTV